MFELTKESAVEAVLFKRFNVTSAEDVDNISEINIWYAIENTVNDFGISVEVKFEDNSEENYHVNKEGIVFSWGDTPVIDARSQTEKLKLETVYKLYVNDDEC